MKRSINKVGVTIYFIGVSIILISFFIGFFFSLFVDNLFGMDTKNDSDFNFVAALPWWIGGFVTGMIFIGFSEIIKILHRMDAKIGYGMGLQDGNEEEEKEKTLPL